MTQRTRLALIHSSSATARGARAAAGTAEADLARQCVWQWQTRRAPGVGVQLQLVLPEYPDYALRRFWK